MQPFAAGKIRGIDVSHHNGYIDWEKVKNAGIQFAYIKATEGTSYVDPKYIYNAKSAIAQGIQVGAYHFAHPDNDPVEEAKHFVDQLEKINYSLLPALDLEVAYKGATEAALVRWAKTFADYVRKERKCDVLLYTGIWYINKFNGLNGLEDMPLWASIYRNSCPDAGGWRKWTIWQYTDEGQVDGITGKADMNIAESLDYFKVGTAVIQPSVKPEDKYVLDTVLPIGKGAKGPLVEKIQRRLNTQPVDGLFGAKTEADVKLWQSLHDETGKAVPKGKGLVADGIVGEKTYYAMFPEEKPHEPAYDVTVDGENVVTSAYDEKVLEAITNAIKGNKAKEIVIKRIDY